MIHVCLRSAKKTGRAATTALRMLLGEWNGNICWHGECGVDPGK